MQKAGFVAVCPFEIGDVLVFGSRVEKITDILAIHSLKTGKVNFRYEFNGSGEYKEVAGQFARKGNVFVSVNVTEV